MPYGEVYSSIRTGGIDGAENNWPSFESSGHFELAGYHRLDEHRIVPEVLVMGWFAFQVPRWASARTTAWRSTWCSACCPRAPSSGSMRSPV